MRASFAAFLATAGGNGVATATGALVSQRNGASSSATFALAGRRKLVIGAASGLVRPDTSII